MHKTFQLSRTRGQRRWLWTAGALLPLALMGCQPRTPVQSQGNTPQERVAGERQEQGDTETMRVIQEATLPPAFVFGGRAWRAHQVHWVNPTASDRTDGNPATGTESTGTTATPGTDPGATPGTTSTDVAPGTGTPGTSATGGDNDNGMGGFIPVATFTVNGHQIFRRSDADEAVTDNIYLQAQNARRMNPQETGTAESTDSSTQMAFVEYDVAEDLLKDVELSQLLQVTGLPQTVQNGGKTWRADEIQTYDPDVFDELKPAAQNISGHPAFVGDETDEMWLQADLDPTMLKSVASAESGATTDPASDGMTTGTDPAGTAWGAEAGGKGPIFIKYDTQ